MNETVSTVAAVADVATAKASGYLQQLCKHFGHKIPVSFDPSQGRIEFEAGVCELDATEPGVLRLRVSARDAEGLARLEGVVGSHLGRFAFREELRVEWRPA